MSGYRLATGGHIDRTRPLSFSYDGRIYSGFEGDTLASALLANGVDLVGRSFKYHRPRGLFGAGADEPNAVVQLESGPRLSPNRVATEVPLYAGLVARSVNAWPSLDFDLYAVNDRLSRLLPAGFYYKTFMWPNWNLFEGTIRKAAGLGTAPTEPDVDRYRHRFAHCDVLVIGAGPAGLNAAREAALAGAKVLMVEAEPALGGSALWRQREAGKDLGIADLEAMPNLTILTRTTAFGYYDHNLVAAVEHCAGGERLWKIRAGAVILATGAIERPLVFPNNDVPGVMLASAVQRYAHGFGVAAGKRAVLFGNNDGLADYAAQFAAAGIEVVATLDTRRSEAVLGVRGRKRVRAVRTSRGDIACDLLAVSGGWNPVVHLFSQSSGSIRFCEKRQMFVPEGAVQAVRCVGGAAGDFDLDTQPWHSDGNGKAFVDLANDVTAADVRLAARENYASVEHLKRYTTLGMGPDQGKTSNVNGLMLMGEATGRTPGEVGTTRFRPPYTPVSFGAIAGARTSELVRPRKYLPAYRWHEAQGAVFEDYGWQRPEAYPQPGESIDAAALREAKAVRSDVGFFDASPLGKIEVWGSDAARFLDFIYVGTMSTLKPGRIRYGLMLDENGVIIDDGVAIRLADDRFLLHTTSAGAERIAAMLDEWLQCEFSGWHVCALDCTLQWGTLALSGPKAVPAAQSLGLPIDDLPHMQFREASLGHAPMRIARVSYTGEPTLEISVPARNMTALLNLAAAVPNATPYGIAALEILRIEKGYAHVGADTDGTTTPDDIGMGGTIAKKTSDFVGRRSLLRPAEAGNHRLQLVGLESAKLLTVGAHVMDAKTAPCPSDGFVTSACFSPTLDRPVALARVRNGRSRMGETVQLFDLGQTCTARIVQPGFVDPEGVRLRG
jgi:sarcosine oxidase, subunit alpha